MLVTGPTGSGKTTTLYAALAEINTPDAQDHHGRRPGRIPPARHQPGAGARKDRAHLRARAALGVAPGPGRDPGGRNARPGNRRNRPARRDDRPPGAVDAAHQRRRSRTPMRLLDMGVPRYMVAMSLQLVLAQRLVRLDLRELHRSRTRCSPARTRVAARTSSATRRSTTTVTSRARAARTATAPVISAAPASTKCSK